MSAMQIRYKLSLVLGHIIAFAFASLLTFIPQYYGLITTIYFVAFIVIFILMSARSVLKTVKGKEALEIKSSPLVMAVRRNEVQDLMFKDRKLTEELKSQFSVMGLSILIPFVVIGMFFAYSTFVRPLFNQAPIPIKFLGYLAMYEIPISFSQIMNLFVIRPRMKLMMNIVREFEIHHKGIWSPTLILKFPLENIKVRYSGVRKFVDLVPKQSGRLTVQVITRFYTKRYDKFIEALKKYGGITDSDIERVD